MWHSQSRTLTLQYRNFWESQAPETLQLCAQPPLASMVVDGMAMSYDVSMSLYAGTNTF
jgi:hypothetical protein